MVFTLVFVWVRYYSEELNFSIWLSAIITLLIEVILKLVRTRRLAKLGLKQSEIALAENTINKLVFNSQTENVAVFNSILENKETVKKFKEYLIVTNAKNENFALYPAFSFSDFSADNLAHVLQKVKKHKLKRIIICTRRSSKDAKEISKKAKTEILILESQEVFVRLFKDYNYELKEEDLFKTESATKEIKLKDIAKGAISPNKAKSYFFSSLILLFASYFVSYKIYYLVFASFLLILSLASLTSVWWKKQTVKNIF